MGKEQLESGCLATLHLTTDHESVHQLHHHAKDFLTNFGILSVILKWCEKSVCVRPT